MTTTVPDRPTLDRVTGARDGRPLRAVPATSRTWGVAGLIAGLAGVVAIQASLRIDAVYDPAVAGDAAAITAELAQHVPHLVVMHTGLMLAAVLLPVFGAGLRRRLRVQAPAGSLLPDVAASGLLLTAVAALIGTGLSTEVIFGLGDLDALAPAFGVVVGHWVSTIPFLWVGAGLTGVALAVAALRHQAAPRWIGWVCVVLGSLTLLTGISPLQYLAGFTGPALVLVVGLGFVLGDRRARTAP